MKNRFVKEDVVGRYDIIFIIPTVPKRENQKRVKKIIRLIERYPPSKFNWNIYLAYEGRDWNEAVNISWNRLKNKVSKGFVLMDDDAFPTEKWMDRFEGYVATHRNSLLQFTLIDREGILRWNSRLYALDRLTYALITFIRHSFFAKKYEASSNKYLANKKIKHPIKIHSACFSTVFIPKLCICAEMRIKEKDDKIMYCEDNDFCYSALMKGFRTYQIPNKVIHLHGLTKTKKDYSERDTYTYSYLWLYSKWFTNKEFIKRLNEEGLIENNLVFLKIASKELLYILRKLFSTKPKL